MIEIDIMQIMIYILLIHLLILWKKPYLMNKRFSIFNKYEKRNIEDSIYIINIFLKLICLLI